MLNNVLEGGGFEFLIQSITYQPPTPKLTFNSFVPATYTFKFLMGAEDSKDIPYST